MQATHKQDENPPDGERGLADSAAVIVPKHNRPGRQRADSAEAKDKEAEDDDKVGDDRERTADEDEHDAAVSGHGHARTQR